MKGCVMKYSCELTIDRPRDRVIELFEDTDNLGKWQDGFVSFTPRQEGTGKPGDKADLVYMMGKRRVEMVETIVSINMPEELTATYEAKGVWNKVDNIFSDTPEGHTRWRVETEFRCTGLMWLFARLAPGMFRKETEKYMSNFKAFAESA